MPCRKAGVTEQYPQDFKSVRFSQPQPKRSLAMAKAKKKAAKKKK